MTRRILPMPVPSMLRKVVDDVAAVAGYCWNCGWAERNAGNLSVDVTERIPRRYRGIPQRRVALSERFPGLAGRFLLMSGTGSRMRDVSSAPEATLGLIRIDSGGRAYTPVWGCWGGAQFLPTSELHSHCAIHEHLVTTGSSSRAILHTHPDEVIVMTHLRRLANGWSLREALNGMIPETVIVNPAGVTLVPYRLPGSVELAKATVEALRSGPVVIWEKHGCCATAPDIMEAFDLIDTINKAARLYLLTGGDPSGLSRRQVAGIRDAFHPLHRPPGRTGKRKV